MTKHEDGQEMNALRPYEPKTFGELEAFTKRICSSAMVPPAYRGKPDDAAVAIIYGREVGLPPMTSLQFIAVINGRPSIYGDALPGIALNKGLITDMQEHLEGEGEAMMAVCEVTRPSGTVVRQTFSIADAKQAGLWGKQGPWTQYPRRMLQWRARSWAIRDAAPHGLFGMTAEEARDHEMSERARDVTPPSQSAQETIAKLDENERNGIFDLTDEEINRVEGAHQATRKARQAPTATQATEVPAEPSLALDGPTGDPDNRIAVTWPGEHKPVYLSPTNAVAIYRGKAETKSPAWRAECLKANPQLAALVV